MAEVLGGMLASAVLKVVTQQIGSAIGGKIKLQKNFNDDLQEMKDTLESIEAVLEEAERRSIKEKPVQLWLNRLKNAVCDISDMIDEFEADTQPPARKLAARIRFLTIVPKTCMANKIKKMRQELEKITKQHKDFCFTGGGSSNVQQAIGIRETSSNVEEAQIIGRAEDKQKIMASLSGSTTQEITILPIYGIAGIGKTTLAKLVFNDTQLKDYSRVWVYVSRTFDLNRISNSIVSQVSEEQSQMTEKEMIQKRLGKVLAGKKILIVLDDLWEKDPSKLEELKSMLKVGEGGKVVIIITTRDEGIAKKICTVEPYKIQPLTNDMCWTIIKHKSAFDDKPYNDQLKLIGREIARKCGGVALAAQSIGYLLQTRTSDEWESVKNSEIWNVLALQDESSPHHVPASLMLSYSSMPPYLKLCFAYCAIFPKGHNIVKDDLIHQWISLGFIEPAKIFSTRQLGENYVSHLLGMSFLQHSKSPLSDGMLCEDVTLFTMHDLVHDLARSVMADEVLDASKNGSIGGSSCRYALLTDCSKPLSLSVTSPAKIRALFFLDCSEIELLDAALSSANHVRVLDLSGCKIRKLPCSIARLKQLRYLNAPRIHDESFPECITKLSKLNYLNLHGSRGISTLPESIGKMEGLTHLDLSGCRRIQKLPKSFVNLKDMVHLDLSRCYRVEGVPEALGGLTELQHLNLSNSGVESLPECITKLSKLNYLNLRESNGISTLPESIGELEGLKHLDLSGCWRIKKLPKSFVKLKDMVHLDLSNCNIVEDIPEALGGLTKLQYLNLSHHDMKHQSYCEGEQHLKGLPEVIDSLTELRYLNLSLCMYLIFDSSSLEEVGSFIARISTLSNLEHLDLSYNDGLVRIPESIGSLKKLRTMDLSGCRGLKRLPESMAKMGLKALHVKGCDRLDASTLSRFTFFALLPHFVVHASDGESRSNLVLLQHANPDELKISRLENVKSAQEAQSIKLKEKQRIKQLEFAWTRDAERSVEDMEVLGELVLPSTLKWFKIRGYNSVSFPAWLMDIRHFLPNLYEIKMEDLPNCKCLPPLGQIPNLRKLLLADMHGITKIDEGFYGGARAFPRLRKFELRGMKSLEEWNTTHSKSEEGSNELMFPELQTLGIYNCPMLRNMRQFTSLQELLLYNCGGLDKWCLSRSIPFALLPHFVVHAGDGESRSNLVLLQHANPDELKISRLENVKSAQEAQSIKLKEKQRIKELEFVWTRDAERSVEDMEVLGELVLPSTLKQFKIRGYNSVSFPAWLMDIRHFLPNLYEIKMEDLPNCKCLPPLGQLPNLRKLLLADMHGITKIDEGFYGGARAFPQLREFELRSMKSLEEWNTTYSSGEKGSNELMFPNRRRRGLRITDLPNCKCLPPLGQLPNLRKLLLADMHGITKIDEGFYGGTRAFPRLRKFELHGMKSLEKWNTTYSSGEKGTNELMFPNLGRLTINNCPMLRMKPHPPRAVEEWIIERSDNMISSWGETHASSSSATVSLEVRCCEVPLHRWRLLRHLPTLRGLTTINCSDLTGSPQIVRYLSSLESLSLEDQDPAELPKWLGELTSLKRLHISNYPDLKDLQGNMRQLTSLEVLELSQCRSMASLPPWLGELTSLQALWIKECKGIKSLPDSIQQLTNLKLSISFCPELKRWCESEENKKKLAHINEKAGPGPWACRPCACTGPPIFQGLKNRVRGAAASYSRLRGTAVVHEETAETGDIAGRQGAEKTG